MPPQTFGLKEKYQGPDKPTAYVAMHSGGTTPSLFQSDRYLVGTHLGRGLLPSLGNNLASATEAIMGV